MKVPYCRRFVSMLLFVLFSPCLTSAEITAGKGTGPAGPALFGPSPYLSPADSPFAGLSFEYFFREDFEDGQLNTPGVSSTGIVGFPGQFSDSVDSDDGAIDGHGNQGRALFAAVPQGITFTFDAAALGHLPTHAGVVWTDAESPRTTSVFLESFNANGSSSGVFGPFTVGDNTTGGTTLEDRFLGVVDPGGISAIRIFHQAAQIEVDHLQYGWLPCEGDPCITGLAPRSGGDTGAVTVRITGQGFSPDSLVQLTRVGQDPIPAEATVVGLEGLTLSATLDLRGKMHGPWDLTIIPPGGNAVTQTAAFTIEEGQEPEPWVDVVGPRTIRAGRPTEFAVFYGAWGNSDVADLIVWIAVPSSVTLVPLAAFPVETGEVHEEPSMIVDGLAYYWFFTDRLVARENGTLRFMLTSASTGALGIKVGALPATALLDTLSMASVRERKPSKDTRSGVDGTFIPLQSELQPGDIVFKTSGPGEFPTGHQGIYIRESPDCEAGCVIDFVPKRPPNPFLLWGNLGRIPLSKWATGNTFQGGYRLSANGAAIATAASQHWQNNEGRLLPYGIPPTSEQDNCVSWVNDRLREAGFEPFWKDWSSPGAIYELLTRRLWPSGVHQIYKLSRAFIEVVYPGHWALFRTLVEVILTAANSFDPNDKFGPGGAGEEHYFTSILPLRYAIDFENLPAATAPAQEVVITDQLNPETVDLSSLAFGQITFVGRRLLPPAGVRAFVETVDLRPAQNLLVRIEGSLYPPTGLLTWRFTSLDPVTGLPPEDPLVGFLPPNVNPPEGSGGVLFTVRPKPELATGTEIRNSARIFFDNNAPIDTPEWLNTLDASLPDSSVQALPQVQSSATFTVTWSGSDEGAGIKDYSVFVSEDSGAFTPWLVDTPLTTATFSGRTGASYAFYSLARDFTGQREPAPVAPDATTQVGLFVPPDSCPSLPNPGDTLLSLPDCPFDLLRSQSGGPR